MQIMLDESNDSVCNMCKNMSEDAVSLSDLNSEDDNSAILVICQDCFLSAIERAVNDGKSTVFSVD